MASHVRTKKNLLYKKTLANAWSLNLKKNKNKNKNKINKIKIKNLFFKDHQANT